MTKNTDSITEVEVEETETLSAKEVAAKLGKILQGADPPHSEAAVQALLHKAGFGQATRFFSSLFWGAWLACRLPVSAN